jgi:Kef-type K+ transport system membrane component KefB
LGGFRSMGKVFVYSSFLIFGLFFSQLTGLASGVLVIEGAHLSSQNVLQIITQICMAYILIEVGLDFHIDSRNEHKYAKDFIVAFLAAILPWTLCFGYFYFFFNESFKSALMVGGFAAPTSAGLMLMLLASAGLSKTWVFRRARVLAIFDDLIVIMLLIPLQMCLMGLNIKMFFGVLFLIALLLFTYRYRHHFVIPLSTVLMFSYGFVIWSLVFLVWQVFHLHVGVVFPAFCLGCMIRPGKELFFSEREEQASSWDFDHLIKAIFMFGIGLSIPQIHWVADHYDMLVVHVLAITVLSNLGKGVIALFYRKEATLRERIALGIAMFPRAEVGAGILLMAIKTNLGMDIISISGIALGLNLLLTGLFIFFVRRLICLSRPKSLS